MFGDIGTSPIYALQTVFNPTDPHPVPVTTENVHGVVSLVFWSVVIIVMAARQPPRRRPGRGRGDRLLGRRGCRVSRLAGGFPDVGDGEQGARARGGEEEISAGLCCSRCASRGRDGPLPVSGRPRTDPAGRPLHLCAAPRGRAHLKTPHNVCFLPYLPSAARRRRGLRHRRSCAGACSLRLL
ncbi:KUP/HAK/KT family potassium transporter [Streptomyces sp. NPDC059193]|uniref:KUP/HAK/KT family potassium transporter n=1 Tax=Streptomyces sp. NPDC059193 TaxID=3346763 RepID=UPI0036C53890